MFVQVQRHSTQIAHLSLGYKIVVLNSVIQLLKNGKQLEEILQAEQQVLELLLSPHTTG